MNKLFAIAVLLGAISAQQVMDPATGLDIDPRDVHHMDEKKMIEEALARKNDDEAKGWGGLFKKRNGKKAKRPSTLKGLFSSTRKHAARPGNRRLQKKKQSFIQKLAADHKAKQSAISAKKAQAPESGEMKLRAERATKMQKFKKMQQLKVARQKRTALLAKKFKMTPEGKIVKDANGKPVKNN